MSSAHSVPVGGKFSLALQLASKMAVFCLVTEASEKEVEEVCIEVETE
ncbi:hypothetical protein ACFLWR_00210 [Chloroflexota bacterium]